MAKKKLTDPGASSDAGRRRNNKPEVVAAASDSTPRTSEPTYEEIAEAAYQRYLRRGGNDGQDFEDWLEAERELRARDRP